MIYFKKMHAGKTQKHLKEEDEVGSSEPRPAGESSGRRPWHPCAPAMTAPGCATSLAPSPKASIPLVPAPPGSSCSAEWDRRAAASSMWKGKDCIHPCPRGMRGCLCREFLTWESNGNIILFCHDSLRQPYWRQFLAYLLICMGY